MQMSETSITYALAKVEPQHYREMVVGDEITAAAGYRIARYFLERYYTIVCSRSEVAPGVYSCHGERAHWYEVAGRPVTLPASAQAVKAMVKAEQRTRAEVPIVWTTPTPGSNV